MEGHGRIGRTYAGRVLQLITGSTGLDDWEWGVTLLADDPKVLKEIVYEMRFDEVSARYGEFGPFTRRARGAVRRRARARRRPRGLRPPSGARPVSGLSARRAGYRPRCERQRRFERGLRIRREVLGRRFVDANLSGSDAFMMTFQHLVTELAWGRAWSGTAL